MSHPYELHRAFLCFLPAISKKKSKVQTEKAEFWFINDISKYGAFHIKETKDLPLINIHKAIARL